ncbi:MAG: ABC transporter permease subunit [Clostridia bacterium]|nr:ABC transporter permease subunit [Clostridia bacterium]
MKKKSLFSVLGTWVNRVMYPGREVDRLAEEKIISPGRQMLKSFLHNRLAMSGLIIFLACLLLVTVGPQFSPLDLSYTDGTQQNVAPGYDMMKVPSEIVKNIAQIQPGPTFGFALTDSGEIASWGKTGITSIIDLADVPEDVQKADIALLAVGSNHAIAVDSSGKIYGWGSNRLGQLDFPRKIDEYQIKQLVAGNNYSALLDVDGTLVLWGNSNGTDLKVKKDYQGNIEQVALADNCYVALTKDGAAVYAGFNTSALLSNVPDGLESGVVQVAATAYTAAALKEDGTVVVWGNPARGENRIPEHDSKIIKLYGGRYHYVAECEDGTYIAWGNNTHGQCDIPADLAEGKAEAAVVSVGYYQNYVISTTGELYTWGLKGYLFGTDELGRDVLNRIINGGKVTMTVGAVSVIISLIIGVIFGLLSGYFGSWIDLIISRLAEVVNSLPFLPMAMILSTVIGSRISQEARMYLIMVIQGFLYWPTSFRIVRAQVLQARENEYIVAARAMGEKESSIMFKQILPNILSQLLVTATLSFATCMLTESSLSYLGFGIVAPTPTWGNMLKGANDSTVIQLYWWRWVFTALIFGITTISINLMGDGMRDAVDPKSLER